jgi:hypothetical protein
MMNYSKVAARPISKKQPRSQGIANSKQPKRHPLIKRKRGLNLDSSESQMSDHPVMRQQKGGINMDDQIMISGTDSEASLRQPRGYMKQQ